MNYKNRTAAILGSTGSVGTQAVDALLRLGVKINMLTAGRNIGEVRKQISQCSPEIVAVLSEDDKKLLESDYPDVKFYSGDDGILEAIETCGSDLIVHSISGMAGIAPALCAAKTGARIAMANKEAIISAGHLIYAELKKSGGEMIPVDSEHSAIFQCLMAQGAARLDSPADSSSVRRILLTASGGPFFGKSREEMRSVTPEMALAHPTWKMGKKITIDSATLMNKGFEMIEACRLFNVTPDRVEIIVHRQSIIHSMVEYTDGAVIAEMSYPDMRDCVRYALAYPDRAPFGGEPLDFAKLGSVTFEVPDYEAFPLLTAARRAYEIGDTAPAALIAADEEAVAAFLQKRIGFTDISDVVTQSLNKAKIYSADNVSDIYKAEKEARLVAGGIIDDLKKA